MLKALILALLPARWRTVYARHVLGWDIDPSALIGRSIIRVDHVRMGPNSQIGPTNNIRGLRELVLGDSASIGARNSIWTLPHNDAVFGNRPDRQPSLVLGDFAFVSSGHEIDCADRVELAPYAGLTGYGSQILTHRLDLVRDEVATTGVRIGEHSVVMTGCILLSGTDVADCSIVSAGSVVVTSLTEPYTLYRGNPAQAVRELPRNLRVFRRVGLQKQIAGNQGRDRT